MKGFYMNTIPTFMNTLRTLTIFGVVFLMVGVSVAAEPVGWRTDGTGKYPDATPPTEWGIETNIVWDAPLAGWSNASPVVVGDRIFTCIESDKLVCLSKTDGKILWQAQANYKNTLTPGQLGEMKAASEKMGAITKKIKPLKNRKRKLYKQLKQLKQSSPAASTQPEEQKTSDQIQAEIKDLDGQINAIDDQAEPLKRFAKPTPHGVNGWTSQTPVTNGKVVGVLFGSGIAACYDMDGNRVWARFIESPRLHWSMSASPVIVGDKLIVAVNDLVALDLATGDVAWTVKSEPQYGTPVVTKIGDVDVVLSTDGKIIRAADGKVLASDIIKLTYSSPVVQDGVVYYIQEGCKAIRLPKEATEAFQPEVLWEIPAKPKKGQNNRTEIRYYSSPIVHDGLIYSTTRYKEFIVIDAENGEVVYEKKLEIGRKKDQMYPSLVLAGGLLFVTCDNGETIVLTPGREYKEIARNTLKPFRSTPVFLGDKMYVRARRNFYCIGK